MEILHTFGFDWRLLLAQIVNFVVIFWVLKKFLYKPLFEVLKNREQTIKKGIQQAEEAQIALAKAQEEERKLMQKAAVEAKKFLEDAKKQAEEIIERSHVTAKEQTTKMIADAKAQIIRETKLAETKLAQHVSRLAVEFLKKSLSGLASPQTQEEILDKAIKKLKGQAN